MKNETIGKINSIGKVSRIVARIAQVIAGIGAVVCLVAVIIFSCVPNDFAHFDGRAEGKFSVDTTYGVDLETDIENDTINILGAELEVKVKENFEDKIQNLDIEFIADDVEGSSFKLLIVLSGVMGMLCSVALWVVMKFTVKLSKTLETCSSPFEENVLADMKKLGISLIPFGVVAFGISGVSGLALVLIIMVVLLFIHIFKYGAELQQESDDTV